MKPYSNRVLFARLLGQARPFWPHIGVVLLLDLLATPLALLTPLPLKIAVDNVLQSRSLPRVLSVLLPESVTGLRLRLLLFAVALQILIVALTRVRDLVSYVLYTRIGESLAIGLRARLFRHVQRLSLSYHDLTGTADSLYRIQYDAPAIQLLLVDSLVTVVSSALMFMAMVYVIARINLALAIVALLVAPLVFILSNGYDRRMRGQYSQVKDLEKRALNVVYEVLTGVRLVKAFGREDREAKRFAHHSGESLHARVRLARAEGAIVLAVNLTTALGSSLVLYIGARSVLSGAMSIGQLLVVLAYLTQLYQPLETVSNRFASFESSLASGRRALELLDEVPEVVERPHARALAHVAGAFEFRCVSFSYNHGTLALKDVSFAVSPKARVGILGKTGAGKSTLASLLTRFYDPTAGQILLDGVDLRDYKVQDLRRQFGIVQQETILFSTTIAENIAYAHPEASESVIVEAAKRANAHDFIQRLPRGYDTEVGERGMALSGGERQRIALARAFLKDAPILILDEPTSAIDWQTEAGIVEAVERLTRDRTTFIIAHRLSTMNICNVLLIIEEGRLTSIRYDGAASLEEEQGKDVVAEGLQ